MIQIKPLYILIDRFHAALPVSDNRILVSGGCSAIGALQDVHIFNTGEQVFFFFFLQYYCYFARSINIDEISCFLIELHFFSPPDTNMWTSLVSPLLCSRPRAGHSMMLLGSAILRDTGTHGQGENVKIQCALLVFGGSDCSGSFYDDTIKCTVEIPFDK